MRALFLHLSHTIVSRLLRNHVSVSGRGLYFFSQSASTLLYVFGFADTSVGVVLKSGRVVKGMGVVQLRNGHHLLC